jgi:tRNA(Ile)-lysidine synthase
MQKLFLEQLHALGCFRKKILVAVSGGLDSIVLLELLVKSGCPVGIAHVNFQLRGEESDQDEAFVVELANTYRVPVFVNHFDTKNYATATGVSIQMAARELRYDWFFDLLSSEEYDCLATAHHLNDNLETVLINFTRGTGLTGLKGMQSTTGKIIRPLLDFSRTQLEDFAKINNLAWREDSSNATDDYGRNFVRHRVIPKLKELNPSLEETFTRNIQRWSAAKELMDLGIYNRGISLGKQGPHENT